MFKAALFTIAKTWKQPKYPSTDEWIKKMWYIYIYIYIYIYTHTHNGILPSHAICSNILGPREYHTKCIKSDSERQMLYDITYMWNLKNNTNELIYKTERDTQT